MNTIPQDQNEPRQIDRLAAQRQLYTDAKRLLGIQMILSGPLVVGGMLTVVFFPSLKVYAAFWGILVALSDIILFTPWQKALKLHAAKIQELFDCEVLKLEWRSIKAGQPPDPESVIAAAKRYKVSEPGYSSIKDWYPLAIGQLPLHMARIVCQRTNCWWDANLRRRYAFVVIAGVVVLTAIIILIGLAIGLTLENFFLLVIAPLLPAFVIGTRQFMENIESAKTLDHLKSHADSFWNKAISEKASVTSLTRGSCELQDEIFDNRRRSPLIFNWVYQLLRDDKEERMNKTAEELVAEAKALSNQ